ncbi:hypothetical protein [Photobacterium sp. 53610]|uniref:hypothetical protein n=1 Tax=Photobacterium sp. 53610 TaxID=3102789 RepID=UPI002ED881F4
MEQEKNSHLKLEDFLSAYRLTWEDLEHSVEAKMAAIKAKCCFVGGSLVEGFGTLRSDIDLFILYDNPLPLHHVEMVKEGSILLDVEYWDFNHVETLLERLEENYLIPSDNNRRVLEFTPEEREFLHRLYHGRSVFEGDGSLKELQARIRKTWLQQLLFDRSIIRCNNAHLDVIGALDSGDLRTAAYQLQSFVGFLADIHLSGIGYTNPAYKWRFAALERFAEERVASFLFELWSQATSDIPTRIFNRVLRAADWIIPEAQRCLENSEYISVPLPRTLLTNEGTSRSSILLDSAAYQDKQILPALKETLKIRWVEGALHIYDIDSMCARQINDIARIALLHFNGRTELGVALHELREYTPAEPGALRQGLHDLCTLVEAEGWSQDSSTMTHDDDTSNVADCFYSMSDFWNALENHESGRCKGTIWDTYEAGDRRELEYSLARQFGSPAAVVITSGMGAITCALLALAIKTGAKPIVNSWASYFENVDLLDNFLSPLFADSDIDRILLIEPVSNEPNLSVGLRALETNSAGYVIDNSMFSASVPWNEWKRSNSQPLCVAESIPKYLCRSASGGVVYGEEDVIECVRSIARRTGMLLCRRSCVEINSDTGLLRVGERLTRHSRNAEYFAAIIQERHPYLITRLPHKIARSAGLRNASSSLVFLIPPEDLDIQQSLILGRTTAQIYWVVHSYELGTVGQEHMRGSIRMIV